MNLFTRWMLLACAILIGTLSGRGFADDTPVSDKKVDEAVVAGSDQEPDDEPYTPKSKSELRRSLTAIQYDVTQNEATEPAFRNKYWNNKSEGVYECIVCGRDLFGSETKFNSGTGWPSFYAPLNEKHLGFRNDWRLIYTRIEVHCQRCGAHLGHVFDDGPPPTGKRYCMNSASLKFVEKSRDPGKADESAQTVAAKRDEE